MSFTGFRVRGKNIVYIKVKKDTHVPGILLAYC